MIITGLYNTSLQKVPHNPVSAWNPVRKLFFHRNYVIISTPSMYTKYNHIPQKTKKQNKTKTKQNKTK